MAVKKPLNEVFHFDEEGTLHPPGPIGRMIRLAVGLLVAILVFDWLTRIDSSDYNQPFILLLVANSVALAPYVVNIGFGVNWGAIPRYILIGVWVMGACAGFLLEGTLTSELLWTVVEITQVYIYGHLGISFLLSAILATPGCEMRALPHLFGKLSGTGSREHYCPGLIDKIDRWEQRRKHGSDVGV